MSMQGLVRPRGCRSFSGDAGCELDALLQRSDRLAKALLGVREHVCRRISISARFLHHGSVWPDPIRWSGFSLSA